jgi:hypothetical protein
MVAPVALVVSRQLVAMVLLLTAKSVLTLTPVSCLVEYATTQVAVAVVPALTHPVVLVDLVVVVSVETQAFDPVAMEQPIPVVAVVVAVAQASRPELLVDRGLSSSGIQRRTQSEPFRRNRRKQYSPTRFSRRQQFAKRRQRLVY